MSRNERERRARLEHGHDPPQHLRQLIVEGAARERGVGDALQCLEPRRRDLRVCSRGALAIEQLATFAVGAPQVTGVARIADEGGALAAHHTDLAEHRRHDECGEAIEHEDEREVGDLDRKVERSLAPEREADELERHDERRGARADVTEPECGGDDEEHRE